MHTDLTMIAAELESISDELDAATEKLDRYATGIDMTRVRSAYDLLSVLDAVAKHIPSMGLYDPECIVAELENAMSNTRYNIDSAAISAAISIARLAPREHVDIDLGNRLSHARAALVEANRRNDLFAAACAVEQMERAVMERPAAEIAVSAN